MIFNTCDHNSIRDLQQTRDDENQEHFDYWTGNHICIDGKRVTVQEKDIQLWKRLFEYDK